MIFRRLISWVAGFFVLALLFSVVDYGCDSVEMKINGFYFLFLYIGYILLYYGFFFDFPNEQINIKITIVGILLTAVPSLFLTAFVFKPGGNFYFKYPDMFTEYKYSTILHAAIPLTMGLSTLMLYLRKGFDIFDLSDTGYVMTILGVMLPEVLLLLLSLVGLLLTVFMSMATFVVVFYILGVLSYVAIVIVFIKFGNPFLNY